MRRKGASRTRAQGWGAQHGLAATGLPPTLKNPKGTDEGKTFLFSRTVSTDPTGNVSFAFKTAKKVALGQTITSTARRASTLETSEFSAPRTVVSA